MQRIFTLLLLVLTLASYGQKPVDYSKRLKGVDKELNQLLDDWKAAGFAVAVVHKDQVIYTKGFGYKDFENKKPVTANTLFAIGSVSKSFTSGLIGLLEKEGKISLDERPGKYIPSLRFFNDELNDKIMIRDLMSHRTGIPRHDFSWYFFNTSSKTDLIARLEYQEPFTGLRQQWYYNNFMFLLQGAITENITGKSWDENIQEAFFNPLEMNTSNTTIDGMKKGVDASFGYQVVNGKIRKMDYYDINGMSPAGSINSSVNEMSNYLMMWIQGGKYKGNEILPPNYVSQAMSSQMVMNASLPGKEHADLHMLNYGFGWMLSSYRGHYRVQHGGNIDGFSANAAFYPSDSLGIVVLANQNGSQIPGIARNILIDRLLGLSKEDWNGEALKRAREAEETIKKMKQEKAKNANQGKSGHYSTDLLGEYENPGYGTFKVDLVNDSLFALFENHKIWLKHDYFDVYQPHFVFDFGVDTTNVPGFKANFKTNDMGDISGVYLKLEPMLEPLYFNRTPIEVEVDTDVLNSYVGNYEISGMTAKVYIKNESILFLMVPGQPEYELVSMGKHRFAFKTVDGFSVEFLENEEGEISAMNFIQPNGTFKATKSN